MKMRNHNQFFRVYTALIITLEEVEGAVRDVIGTYSSLLLLLEGEVER
jgi:hypothetical protein